MAQDPMVAAESPFIVQTYCSQGGGYGPFSRSQDRSDDQHLDVLPDAFGKQWREGEQDPYHPFR
jgi:hypothetical protein